MNCKRSCQAFSRSDLLVTLGVVFLLGVVGFVWFSQQKKTQTENTCAMNLKRLGVARSMWVPQRGTAASPWADDGVWGSAAATNSGCVRPHFLTLSNYIIDAKILTCPGDGRRAVKSWVGLGESNISYFVNFDSSEIWPGRVVFGDRRFNSTIAPATNNLLILSTNATYQWEAGIHQGQGTLSYGDGSVRSIAVQELNAEFHKEENLGSRIQLPR